ncbi:MAG: DUF4093 domain-containing protein [Oscillospiraceae bacterium]|nr:DUF4093 domain-containing protein [Oscillospiraceae bacterium]
MIETGRAIVVEGRYDLAHLSGLTKALIITTDGFNIRRDTEKQELIKRLARECGLIILTDSDDAGFQIRKYIEDIAGKERVLHAYVPDIRGRERRKSAPSGAGLLGVEGIAPVLIEKALADALKGENGGFAAEQEPPITSSVLYEDGLLGAPNAAQKRAVFLKAAGLPTRLSTSAMLKLINRLFGRSGYKKIIEKLQK